MSGKYWTEQEIIYLERHWYTSSLDAMTKYLGRSKISVRNKARAIGLGRQVDGGGDTMTIKMINQAFGKQTVSHMSAAYMEKNGLKVRRFRFGRVNRYVVRIDDFWEWLKLHQQTYPVAKLEPLALGPEPEWVDKARAAARKFPIINNGKAWTEHENMLLINMSRQKRPIKEICAALKRSENAVRCHTARLWAADLSYSADMTRRPWTEDEEKRLVELAKAGHGSMEISHLLGRSEHMVRIRLKQLCGTSSIEKLHAMEENGKNGKRKRAKAGSAGRARAGTRAAG